jgi:hypothetical protein
VHLQLSCLDVLPPIGTAEEAMRRLKTKLLSSQRGLLNLIDEFLIAAKL